MAAFPENTVRREGWNAIPSAVTNEHGLQHPIPKVLLSHTDTEPCTSKDDCVRTVQDLQRQHLMAGFPDIKYNFLVGGDGNLYEGRGWNYKPEKSELYPEIRDTSLNIAFVGPKGLRPPKEETTLSKLLVKTGVDKNFISENPIFYANL